MVPQSRPPPVNIAGRDIGSGQACFVVAEISSCHMGRLDYAHQLIDAAKQAGADAVKFQCFTIEEIVGLRGDGPAPAPWQRYTRRELWQLAQTPFQWFPELFAHAREVGLIPFSSVLGVESLALLESLDCPAYKVSHYEWAHDGLLGAVGLTGKPVIVSVPHSGVHTKAAATLYCPGGYPAGIEDVHLSWMNGGHIGISSHCLAPELPVAAVARGAHILEYHLMLPNTTPLDVDFSHTPESFAAMVQSVRATETLLG